MGRISDELKEKVRMAHSADEIAELLRADGTDEVRARNIKRN